MFPFKILHKDGKARVGRLKTAHGIVETPSFNPVGTQATVKALSPRDLKEIGVQIVLANTYHLMLRPGDQVVKKLGGLHKFMGWDGPIMTDSGGFQVFSLGVALELGGGKVMRPADTPGKHTGSERRPRLNRITEEGVEFQSHLDGSKHFLTPEKSMQIQLNLGSDLVVAFDDHESSKYTREEMIKSLELTERWGLRSLEALKKLKSGRLIYGVVHGAWHKDLRVRSAQFTDKHFPAIAIGGIYETKQMLYRITDWVFEEVSDEKPRHMLGVGEVEDLFECIERGADLFDCVAPTRRARNGSLYISPKSGGNRKNYLTMSIRRSEFVRDPKPIDLNCACYTCQNFSRAYLRHLFMAGEILYHQLAAYHNVFFITELVREIREAVARRQFKKLKGNWLGK
ncbi:MAG: queuine tRNA-ribosyltransferase [Microgenomates group bacterium Gr01-1014_80]|nr:MAG: queuine tRNA-ribosyltransferase [Microgenomates group bacterium Gr01-1014_80]